MVGVAIAGALGLAALGCGGGGEDSSSPTSVSETDLQQDAAYWSSLDDSLRRELAGICQSAQVSEAEGAQATLTIQDLDTDDYVAEINAIYAESSLEMTIEEACEAAKQEILSQNVEELLSK